MFQKISYLIVRKKTELKGDTKAFSVHYDSIDINDILNMHRFLMKET